MAANNSFTSTNTNQIEVNSEGVNENVQNIAPPYEYSHNYVPQNHSHPYQHNTAPEQMLPIHGYSSTHGGNYSSYHYTQLIQSMNAGYNGSANYAWNNPGYNGNNGDYNPSTQTIQIGAGNNGNHVLLSDQFGDIGGQIVQGSVSDNGENNESNRESVIDGNTSEMDQDEYNYNYEPCEDCPEHPKAEAICKFKLTCQCGFDAGVKSLCGYCYLQTYCEQCENTKMNKLEYLPKLMEMVNCPYTDLREDIIDEYESITHEIVDEIPKAAFIGAQLCLTLVNKCNFPESLAMKVLEFLY